MIARPVPPPTQEGDLRGFLVEAVRPALLAVVRWIERKYGLEPACPECRRRRAK